MIAQEAIHLEVKTEEILIILGLVEMGTAIEDLVDHQMTTNITQLTEEILITTLEKTENFSWSTQGVSI